MRVGIGVCLVAGTVGLAPFHADGQELHWRRIEVDAHLRNDGTFAVTERWEIDVPEGWTSLDRELAFGAGQRVLLRSFGRIGEDGVVEPLEAGGPETPGEYEYTEVSAFLRWGVEPRPGASLRFAAEYEVDGALAPAWDLAAGPAPLDVLAVTYGSPLERGREVLAAWREAWPALDRHYRLDHDVFFPDRGGSPNVTFAEIHYRLRYDDLWRLLDPGRELGRATDHSDYRVQRTFEYLGPGRPAGVDLRGPSWRLGSMALVPLGGLLLWLGFVAWEAISSAGGARGDRAHLERTIAAEPPETAAALLGEPLGFEELLLRLAAEGKIDLTVERAATDEDFPVTRVRLRADQGSLGPVERDFLEALLGVGREVTTEELAERHRESGFDPDEVLAAIAGRGLPPPVPGRRRLARLLGTVLVAAGFLMAMRDVSLTNREPYVLFGGIFTAFAISGIWPTSRWRPRRVGPAILFLVPVVLLAVACVAFHLAPNVPLGPDASAGLALLILGGYQWMLAGTPRLAGERGRRIEAILAARHAAEAELRREHPDLDDRWIPWLEAVGLKPALETWRSHRPRGRGETAPLRASPFTGRRPAPPALDPDWFDGFYVYPADEDDEEPPEDAARPEERDS